MLEFLRFITNFLKEKERGTAVWLLAMAMLITTRWVSGIGDRNQPEFAPALYLVCVIVLISIAVYLLFWNKSDP